MILAANDLSTGMSGWAIAGLAVGALVLVVIVIVIVNLLVARLGSRPRDYGPQGPGPGRA